MKCPLTAPAEGWPYKLKGELIGEQLSVLTLQVDRTPDFEVTRQRRSRP